MNYRKIYFLLFLVGLASCKERNYSILEKKLDEGKTAQAFIEASLTSVSNPTDTLLYYKFDLLTDSFEFKENEKLNIGIYYSNITQNNAHVIDLAFKRLSADQKSTTLQNTRSGNKVIFTNIKGHNGNKGMETSFSFTDDKYLSPLAPAQLTNEEKMKDFLKLFKEEILDVVNKSDTIKYASVSHVEGYFQRMVMTAAIQ